MNLAIAQINTQPGNINQSFERMAFYAKRASQSDVDVLVFPLMTLSGANLLSERDQNDFLLDITDALVNFAHNVGCDCLVPLLMNQNGVVQPRFFYISDEEVHPLKDDNVHSWNFEKRDGEAVSCTFLNIQSLRIAIASSYDDLENLSEFNIGTDVILYFDSYGFAVDEASSAMGAHLSEARFVRDALINSAWFVGVSSLGGYGDTVFTGASFVLDPQGNLKALAPAHEEAFLIANVCPETDNHAASDVGAQDAAAEAAHIGAQDAAAEAAQDEVFDELQEEASTRTLELPTYNPSSFLWETLRLGLHDFVEKEQFSDVVLLLDGSLNSMLLASLATDALGPLHVHALLDTGRIGSRVANCLELAHQLRIDLRKLRATEGLSHLGKADSIAQLKRGVAESHLAAWAKELGALCLSPRDKTTYALYGSSSYAEAPAFYPFGDVYKRDIVALARYRASTSAQLNCSSCAAWELPSFEGYTNVGMSSETWIETIDTILFDALECGMSISRIEASGIANPQLVAAVLAALDNLRSQRLSRIACLHVSTVPLSELQAPFGLAWRNYARESMSLAERFPDLYGESSSTSSRSGRRRNSYKASNSLEEQLRKFFGQGDADASADGDLNLETAQTGVQELNDVLNYLRDFSFADSQCADVSDQRRRRDGIEKHKTLGESINGEAINGKSINDGSTHESYGDKSLESFGWVSPFSEN